MKTVIFACVHNAGRSQMAAAFFNKFVNPEKAKAVSAGAEPANAVHPEVLAIMSEVGIDLSNAKPMLLTEDIAKTASLLITMSCGEKCPYIPNLEVRDWPLEDPKGKDLESVRKIRDLIKDLIIKLIESKNWSL